MRFTILIVLVLTFDLVRSDGGRDYGEACSLRSQIANYFRPNDSVEGCISAKGLICVSHKCGCDPTSIWIPPSTTTTSDSSGGTGLRGSIGNLFKKVTGNSESTPSSATVSSSSTNDGRCVGRVGSPCLTETSLCVEHASCQGSPKICRCQGIYSSTPQGQCSKRATVATEVLKRITPGFSGRR